MNSNESAKSYNKKNMYSLVEDIMHKYLYEGDDALVSLKNELDVFAKKYAEDNRDTLNEIVVAKPFIDESNVLHVDIGVKQTADSEFKVFNFKACPDK